jgi:hypothetical protein
LLFVVAVLATAWSACEFVDRPVERVALSVGSRKITPEELKAQRKRMALEPEGSNQERLDSFVERVVDHYLILEYGRQQGSLYRTRTRKRGEGIKKDHAEKDFQELLLKATLNTASGKRVEGAVAHQEITAKASGAVLRFPLKRSRPITTPTLRSFTVRPWSGSGRS